MTLPLLLSVPHPGLYVPPEVKSICALSEQDIIKDSDEGAAQIYLPLKSEVSALVTTDIARAIVDVNRKENDRHKDGIIKTHTSWDIPVYRTFPSEDNIAVLLEKYHRPYHTRLTQCTDGVKLGVDCHTMSAIGPPTGSDAGVERPCICLSDAGFTCPKEWLVSLAECLEKAFNLSVSINHPFRGGYIIRSHAKELPWVQLELSRAEFLPVEKKRPTVLAALKEWCKRFS
jgi:formiminoglutamase